MSRKDYVEAARIISETPMSDELRAQLVGRFVTFFADDNPRFSPSRFREACEPVPNIVEQAEQEGYERGKAAGSWLLDGNSTAEAARRLLDGIEEGDPEILNQLPTSPLSREWADAPLPRDLLESVGMGEDDDDAEDVLSAYENAYSRGVSDEAVLSAREEGNDASRWLRAGLDGRAGRLGSGTRSAEDRH